MTPSIPNPDPLAAALAGLRPAPATAEKPAFLFRAGQASRDAIARRWQVVAALTGLALVGSWAFWYVRSSEYRDRAEAAERRVAELTLAARQAQMPPPEPPPSPISSPALPLLSVPVVPPSLMPDPYPDSDPTPRELADALRMRNEILLGGLTMLPQTKSPTASDRTLPGGVFAIPQLEPKKLPPIIPPDDDN